MTFLTQHNPKNEPALWINDQAVSYGAFEREIKKQVLSLRGQGVVEKQRVSFIASPTIETIVYFLALLEIGACPCLISTRTPLEKIPELVKISRSSWFANPQNQITQKQNCFHVDSETFIFLFTSGSSGTPKLAALKPTHFLESARSSIPALQLCSSCRYLLSVPLFHVSGLSILFRTFLVGGSIVLMNNPLAGHLDVTHLSFVPTQLIRMLDQKTYFPQLKCALIGGAPISENLVASALKKKVPLYLTYGMTELASQITMTNPNEEIIPLHLGKTLPGKKIKISSEGEIWVNGNSLFNGYCLPSGEIKSNLIDSKWFATGDLGSFTNEGNLKIKGRKDNLFISGGENIYPEMIEQALGTLPGVLECIVLPVDDPEFGQRPIAFIRMDGPIPSKESLKESLEPLIPKFCFPLDFLPFPENEANKNFKTKRNELKLYLDQMLAQKRK